MHKFPSSELLSFLPGEPGTFYYSTSYDKWNDLVVLAYSSGNNLIIVVNNSQYLQTIYLPANGECVEINGKNGKIAVSMGAQLHIYAPRISNYFDFKFNKADVDVKWELEVSLLADSKINSISWTGFDEVSGNAEYNDYESCRNCEIVVGSQRCLSLWRLNYPTKQVEYEKIWHKFQPAPVMLCRASPDSKLIASCGRGDRLVRIWERNSFDSEFTEFDMMYVEDEADAVNFWWRPNTAKDDNILYLVTSKGVLKVWSSFEKEGGHTLHLNGEVPFASQTNEPNFLAIVDCSHMGKEWDFCMFMNEEGQLRVFKLELQSPLRLTELNSFHGKCVSFQMGNNCFPKKTPYVGFHKFVFVKGDALTVFHDVVKGTLRLVGFYLETLMECESVEATPHRKQKTVSVLIDKYSGHNKSVQRLIKSLKGESVISVTRFNESFLWKSVELSDNRTTLTKQSFIKQSFQHGVILMNNNYVATMADSQLTLWDCHLENPGKVGFKVAMQETISTPVMHLILLPEFQNVTFSYVVCVFTDGVVQAWRVSCDSIVSVEIDPLPLEDAHKIEPIDPVGWTASISNEANTFSHRDFLSVITREGVLTVYSLYLSESTFRWTVNGEVNTMISECSMIKGSSVNKCAIVESDSMRLSIWDTSRGVVEYVEEFPSVIRDIDWTCNENQQSILSVGFDQQVLLYTQLRYDYTNTMPNYLAIKRVDISRFTSHAIGDSTWLNNGNLLIGCGNQFFISNKLLDPFRDSITKTAIGTIMLVSNDIFHLCAVLNGPLPVYHPQLLVQLIFQGRLDTVRIVLEKLNLKLREFDLKPEGNLWNDLRNDLGLGVEEIAREESPAVSEISSHKSSYSLKRDYSMLFKNGELPDQFSQTTAGALAEKLHKYKLPFLTGHQQITLASVVEIMRDLTNSLDMNGSRFYTGCRLHLLNVSKRNKVPSSISMRDVNFALHSDHREALFGLVQDMYQQKATWLNASHFCLPYWLPLETLTNYIEKVAKFEFLTKRDPSQCALFYLALRKKHLLLGLWRTSAGHPEQAKMLKFLSNDFSDKRWKSAASKNAFALLGKHRYADAASFFLLGDSLKDCVNVVLTKLQDESLAVAICKVYEPSGETLKEILLSHFAEKAIANNDKWTMSWIFWSLKERSKAIQSLLRQPFEMMPEIKHQGYLKSSSDDPVLLVLYDNLRHRNAEYFKGSSEVTPKEEFDFVLRVVSIYNRMGCDYISLFLVNSWRFTESMRETVPKVVDAPAPLVQPPAAVFSEPDMSAFGF